MSFQEIIILLNILYIKQKTKVNNECGGSGGSFGGFGYHPLTNSSELIQYCSLISSKIVYGTENNPIYEV